MNEEELLRIDNVSKFFPGVKALDSVSMQLNKGEVHAIVGENGAGKSTLVNILCGAIKPSNGSVFFKGEKLDISHPVQAMQKGISVVHQELKLIKNLSIVENIFLSIMPQRKLFGIIPVVDRKKMYSEGLALLKRLNMKIDLNDLVDRISLAKQQIVEICKALVFKADLIIMDEPSATLTDKELEVLFDLIKLLKKESVTVIYISHRLDEIFKVADRVTVLRDGKHVITELVENMDRSKLISMMVGRFLENEYPKKSCDVKDVILKVKNINNKTLGLKDISFDLHRGEIMGISGLVGSGRTELANIIFGACGKDSGEILINGRPVNIKSISKAISNKIALVPEDRKIKGVILEMQVQHNISMVGIDKVLSFGVINSKKEMMLAKDYVNKLRIIVPNVYTKAMNLSGGNQQKLVLAKWLAVDSDILIFDEPTRGIDVGAKVEIYNLLSKLAADGKAIIMISSEMPELIGMCDRILVMHEGKINGELKRNEFSQEAIMRLLVDEK